MKSNQDYKNAALAALKGNWAPAVLATVIYALVIVICILPGQIVSHQYSTPEEVIANIGKFLGIGVLASVLQLFVMYPMSVGFGNAFRKLLNTGDNEISANTWKIATDGYGRKVWGMFLVSLFTALWTLLFIIPGIVKIFSYAMTPYILEDNPELTANQAINRSRAMMKGHKFDLFYLELSFIGWVLLCILTLGIGFLWLEPYLTTSIGAFYEDVKEQYNEISIDVV